MAHGPTETLKLDLDTLDFLKKAGEAKGAIGEIGEAKSLAGLVGHIQHMGVVIGGIGAAFFALKGTMELVFEGENIRAINQQFEVLTKNAKISAHELKEGMVAAAGGMVTEIDLLKAANKAIIDMGGSAANLPKLMEVARKSTAIFGGDLKDNFEALNRAISTGATRPLKAMGLTIKDVDKVNREYAKSIGIAANELNASGKQHALMNAIIEKGKTAFVGIDPTIKEGTFAMKQLEVTMKELVETGVLLFEKTVGPSMRDFLKNMRDWANAAKTNLVAAVGDGAEASAARVTKLEEKMLQLRGKAAELSLQDGPTFWDRWMGITQAERVEGVKSEIAKLNAELEAEKMAAASDKHAEAPHEAPKEDPGSAAAAEADNEKKLENQRKFQADLMQLKFNAHAAEAANAESEEQASNALEMRKMDAAVAANAQAAELMRLGQLNNIDNSAKIEQINSELNDKLKSMDDDLMANKIAALDRYQSRSQSASDGVARGFTAGSKKAQLALKDFGKRGGEVFDSVGKHSSHAFESIGAGTATLGQAMKGMFFNVLADRASAEGNLLLLSGLWPPNPVALGAGAGLLALGGFLRSQAGGGGGPSAPAGGGGGGGVEDGYKAGQLNAVSEGNKPEQPEEFKRRSVAINVQGHYFETDESRRRMMEMVRQETDATDFKYTQVGG